jgi:hypothetical protein
VKIAEWRKVLQAKGRFGGRLVQPKYGNKGKDGYASTKEARRAQELELAVKAGVVRNLQRQVRFVLIPKQKGERGVVYIADFCYEELIAGAIGQAPTWEREVEDVKSPPTRKRESYIIKRKLMLERFGIRIRET